MGAVVTDPAALHDPSVQTLRTDVLAERRTALASALLVRLRAATDSYYEEVGAASIAGYPPLTPERVAGEVEAHPPFGRFQLEPAPLIRAGLATAGVPRPTPIAWTRADLDGEARLGARALRRAGIAPRTRTSDCLEGGLVAPGTLAITDALDALDALALPVGPVTSEAALQRAVDIWDIVRPSALIVDAASLDFLCSTSAHSRPQKYVVLLTPAHAAELAASPRPDIFRIFSVPQVCTFAAGECSAHEGLHLAEDTVLAEVVDDGAQPLTDGRFGRLLLTALTRSLALLRYDTGLRAALDRAPCRCGETHARIRFA